MLRVIALVVAMFFLSSTLIRSALAAYQESAVYVCPMHPEVRRGAPGKCPECSMTLIPSDPPVVDEYDLKIDCSPFPPKPEQKVRLRFSFFNPKTGRQVKQFSLMHDKFLHLFIVSQDMNEFQHIHPELEAGGSFVIETILPRAGHYKIYSDIYPADGTPHVLQSNIITAGHKSDLLASRASLSPDASLVKVVDGIKIDLKLDPGEIIAGKPATLKYHLTDAKSGQPVRDLTPYLGAWGHTLILSEDQSDFIHSHPEERVPDTPDESKIEGGPDVTFQALFPRPGIYRLWTQFQRGSTLTTVSFTLKAVRLH